MVPEIDLQSVRRFREAAINMGYRLVRVRTAGKEPVVKRWQDGETTESLLKVTSEATNTDILCCGLRVVDIDVDDPNLFGEIFGFVTKFCPSSPLIRRRANSVRL